jgi:hypothetical protein
MSRILGEWSNMIGYKMGSSPIKVYITAKNFRVENIKHGLKHGMVNQHNNTFAKGVFYKSSFLGNLTPLENKLGL